MKVGIYIRVSSLSQEDNSSLENQTTLGIEFCKRSNYEYEVFKVFPVNYSISHNEDVFKYIKSEILIQLFSKDIKFDKKSLEYFRTAPQFFKNDPVKVISPFVSLLPQIGKSAYEVFESLNKLAIEYFDYHEKMQSDDESKAQNFIRKLYDQEGSVFEDNFYTQLIRQQLEKLKLSNNQKMKNVLIIEDLDRMDPDHIFRILNVLAAHFDSPEFNYGVSNKFGFDKIIIVGDYKNIKNIYAHRYGPKVSFDGYISKYYSREPFIFDNKKAVAELSLDLRKMFGQNRFIGIELLLCILSDLVLSESFTLRELIKLLKSDFQSIIVNRIL